MSKLLIIAIMAAAVCLVITVLEIIARIKHKRYMENLEN